MNVDDLVSIINKHYNNYYNSTLYTSYILYIASFNRYILIGPAIEIFFLLQSICLYTFNNKYC